MKLLSHIFLFWLDVSAKYSRLKESEFRDSSKTLGKLSIVTVLYGMVLAVLSAWGLSASLTALGNGGMIFFLAVLGVLVFAACVIAALFTGLLKSLMYWIYQMKLNKLAIGKVAMALWIVFTIATIAGGILVVKVL